MTPAVLAVNEDPLATLQVMAPYLAHVAREKFTTAEEGRAAERYLCSDTHQTYVSTALNQGLVDMDAVLTALSRIGYNGLFLLEYQAKPL